MQAAADMSEQARQERHHRPRHAGHLDQKAQEHEQRHRQQDQMAHALVHAADQHHQGRARRQREIAENRQSKPESDRYPGEHAEPSHADKEDHQIDVAERTQPWLRQPENRHQQANRQRGAQHESEIADPRQPQQCKQRHKPGSGRQRRGAPDVRDLQRRRRDKTLLKGVFAGRSGDQQKKRQRCAGRDHVEPGPHRWARARDHRGHSHVFGTAKRDRGPRHRKPQEQDRGQFVRPDQRLTQAIAGDDSSKQNDDLGDDQDCRWDLDQHAEPGFERADKRAAARGPRLAGRRC